MTRELFKKLRKDNVITQAEIAKEAGKYQSLVAGYETGHFEPLPEDLRSLQQALMSLIKQRQAEKAFGPLGNIITGIIEEDVARIQREKAAQFTVEPPKEKK